MLNTVQRKHYLRNAEAVPKQGGDNGFDVYVIEGTRNEVASLIRVDLMLEDAALSFALRGRRQEEFWEYARTLRGIRDAHFAKLNPVRVCNVSVHADFRSCLLDWEGPEPGLLWNALERISRAEHVPKSGDVVRIRSFRPCASSTPQVRTRA